MTKHVGARETARSSLSALMMSTGVTLAAAAFGAPALAQDNCDDRPITVIGERTQNELSSFKGTAPLLDTPLTATVIPSDVFEQQGASNLTDVLRNTPGITFNAGENGFSTGQANFSMRGFEASANIFVDGMRDSGSFSRDAFSIAQVEVIKGPASDNGRGAAGGFVNIVTKTPHGEADYRATLSHGFDDYDSDSRTRATIDLNQPLSSDAAARLNLMWEEGGVPGRAIAGRSAYGIAPSFAIGIGQDTRFSLALQFVERQDTPDWGVPAALIEGMLRYDPALDAEAMRDNFYGLASDYDNTTSSAALARLERTLSPNLEFVAQVRWSQAERDSRYTLPFSITSPAVVQTQRQAYYRDNEALSGIASLNARWGAHTLAFGVEFAQEESSASRFGTANSNTSLLAPDPYRATPALAATEFARVEVETAAFFFYDTIELAPQWQLTGGVRVESYDIEMDAFNTVGAPLPGDNYAVSETLVSGRLGLVYKPMRNVSIYGAYGVSPLPPGNFLSSSDISRTGANAFPGFENGLNSPGADVQQSVNYELGAKWDAPDGSFSLSAALFRTVRENVAISGALTPGGAVALPGYGEQIVEGLEIGASGQITERWSIFAGALFMESERDHSAQLDLYRCYANPGDFGAASAAACNADVHRTRGDALAFSPEFTANLWTTYAFDFGLTIGGGLQYVGESFVGRPDDAERIIPNGMFGELPDYLVVNAMASYALTPNVSFRVNVDNLTDEVYAVSTNWPAQRVLLGPPRSVLFSLAVDF